MSVQDVREGTVLAIAVLLVCGGAFGVVAGVVWLASRAVALMNRLKRDGR